MANIEKEIFNQFLIDYMSNKMIVPEGDNGYLTDVPSQMSIPGALSIIKSIPNEDIETNNLLINPAQEKNNFELNLKTENKNFNFVLSGGFYLYYKEYPNYKDLVAGDLKNYINKDIRKERIKIYKNLKSSLQEPDSGLDEYYKKLQSETDSYFEKYLKTLIKKDNKGLLIVIQKIINILKPNFSNLKDIVELEDKGNDLPKIEEKEDLEFDEIQSEIIETKDKGFIFNEDDFESLEQYNEVLNLLSQNNNELYKKLFTDMTINFVYKKIFIPLDPINVELNKDIKEPTSEENIHYSHLIFNDFSKKIKSIIKDQKISLNINQPLSFFNYISEEKYNDFKLKSFNLEEIPFVFYFPKITFLRIKNNIKIIVTGSETIIDKQDKIKAKQIFDNQIFNLNLSLEFNKNDIAVHNYNKNQHYKYNHAKKIYCSSKGVATENTKYGNKILIKTTWNPKYYLPRNENRGISKNLVEYNTWKIDKNHEVNTLNEIIEEYEKWISEIPSHIQNEKEYRNDLVKWQQEIKSISFGIKLLNISQHYYEYNLNKNVYNIYQSWCYTNESFSIIDEKYKEWRLFQLCFLLMFIPSIILKDKTISDNLIEKGIISKEDVENIISDSENRVNLLFFNAGGGKTEAFLGILIFLLFFEHLNGLTHGLTAMIKYPLRLLLTQQTNRVLKAVCSAEFIRRKYKISFSSKGKEKEWDFDRSFSLGIWVGSYTTPNTIKKVKDDKTTFEIKKEQDLDFFDNYGIEVKKGLDWETNLIIKFIDEATDSSEREQIRKELENYSISKIPNFNLVDIRKRSLAIGSFEDNDENEEVGHKKLTTCPFCCKNHITLRVYQESLVHFCLNRNCFWNLTTNSFRPLPFYIMDEDIYTRYPSVIISTTDKLARFGYVKPETLDFPENRYPLGMFGIAPFYEHETKKILWDIPKGKNPNVEPFTKKDKVSIESKHKFPSLIIQDETHLLIEGLGSFSAVFERNFIELIKELDSFFNKKMNITKTFNYPHIIASTATMASPEKQLLPIYNKSKVLLFPSTGFKIYENFYSKPIRKINSNQSSLEEYELYEISRIYNGFFLNDYNYYRATKRYSVEYHKLIYSLYDKKISLEIFEDNIKNNYYANQFKSLKNDPNFNFNDFLVKNSLLNKILINYAGSKNVNDKLKSLEIYLFERDPAIKHIMCETNQVSITSDVEQKVLQSVLYKIINQREDSLTSLSSKEIIKSIFATQSISHGVDSDMFNAMTFHGFPEFINEYIQASARIGRTNVGLVNCFPLPNNKDSLIMNNFEAFHRFIDRPVLSNSVDFSTQKIISRTLLSLFACWFFNIYRLENDITDINNSKLSKVNEKLINQVELKDFYEEFKKYIFKVFSVNINSGILEQRLSSEIYEMLCEPYNRANPALIQKINDISNVHNKKYYMMTSLRDTQETAKIIIQQKK